jgi:hypothetical protein
MSRFNQLPAEILDQISGYLNTKYQRNAFKESNPYVEEVLGQREIDFSDLPPDSIREIERFLDKKSKLAFRSSHPSVRSSTLSLEKQIRRLVQTRCKEILKEPNLLKWLGNEEKKYKQLIEDMCTMYYGDDLREVEVRIDCEQRNLALTIYISLKNHRGIKIYLYVDQPWSDLNAPQWFKDCTKNTLFYEVLKKIDHTSCEYLNIQEDWYDLVHTWDNLKEKIEEILTTLILVRDGIRIAKYKKGIYYYRIDRFGITDDKYQIDIEKEIHPENNQIEVKITILHKNKIEEFIIGIDRDEKYIIAPNEEKQWLQLALNDHFWDTLEEFIMNHEI